MTSFTDDMRDRGLRPASTTLDLRVTSAGARLGRLLHLSPSEPVLVAVRLRLADGESMAIETVHIRAAHVPGLTARDLEEMSFYELLRDRYGIVVVGGEQTIEPTVTDEDESNALGVPLHSPAFRFERVTHSEAGEIVEFVESIYRGDRYRLVTSLSIPQERRRTRSAGADERRPTCLRQAWLVPTARAQPAAGLRPHAGNSCVLRGEQGLDRRAKMWKSPARGRLVQTTWALRPCFATPIHTVRSNARMPREMRMNVRVFAAAALVAALAVVAVGASGASGGTAAQHPDRLAPGRCTVRLAGSRGCCKRSVQVPERRAGTSTSSTRPWGTHLAKFDATLAGNNAPDVIEMGNTEMTKYMAAGAFQDLTVELVPEQEHVARRPLPPPVGSAARSTAFRTTPARGSSPTAPTCSSR